VQILGFSAPFVSGGTSKKSSGGSRNRWWRMWPEATSRGSKAARKVGFREVSTGGVLPLQNFFSILDLKMASFGALWDAGGGCISHPPGSVTEEIDIAKVLLGTKPCRVRKFLGCRFYDS